jgi:flavorubredoxin
MPRIAEVGPDLYRISEYLPHIDLEFALFVVKDEEPLLFHTLMRSLFPTMREAVAKVIDPAKLRWISFSHFEADECGALNEWLTVAPHAQPVVSPLSVLLNVNDFAIREGRQLTKDESLSTGKHRFRYIPTPHLPHGWDAGVMFEETQRTLLCSDLLHQSGDLEPVTESDVLGRVRDTLVSYQGSELLADYMPYTARTGRLLNGLAELEPATLATMHGSVYRGDGARVLREVAGIMKDVLGEEAQPARVSA